MELDLNKLKRYSLSSRKSKVEADQFGKRFKVDGGLDALFDSIPRVLGGKDFFGLVNRWGEARDRGNSVIVGMGAHVIKVGLSPLIIQLMEEGWITHIAVTGAFLVHDVEVALLGCTSEDVVEQLADGSFGMVEDTTRLINLAVRDGATKGSGLALSVAERMESEKLPLIGKSILAASMKLGVGLSAHVALGTDITHMHPEADGASIGKCSMKDFHTFTKAVMEMEGGLYLNVGSAVILPEVFLKAVSMARNLGSSLKDITTGAMDFNRHYRVEENVVRRPVLQGGKGVYLIGHHEIMIPLISAALLDRGRGHE
jgi:hypothetical protein